MKHRRWMPILLAALIVSALFLLSGGINEAEAAGPLSVVWREGAQCWSSDIACGTPVDLDENDFAGYYSIASNDYVVLDSVVAELPEGFYYKDGSTSKQAANRCTAVYPSIGITYGGYNDTAQIRIPYLPNAKSGDVYYANITYTGRVYTRYADREWLDWQNYYYTFTQTVKVPILKVKKAWDQVTVSDEQLGTVTMKWDDAIFTKDYNQKAAEMAAVMSRLAYNEGAMKDMLTQLGCTEIESFIPAESPAENVDFNKMAVFIGEKTIEKNGKSRKIIFAVGRGTNDAYEWLGNLNVGSGAVHKGFQAAGTTLYRQATRRYISAYTEEESSFILFTGHSKAAAAANIAAHTANMSGEYCVAYTFATPTVDRGIGTTNSGEHGIYNWVYYQDVIRNAPSMAQYGRYGSTTVFGFETPPEQYWGIEEIAYWLDSCGVTHTVRNGFTMQEYLNALLYTVDTGDIPGSAAWLLEVLEKNGYSFDEALTSHSMGVYYSAVKKKMPGAYIPDIDIRTGEAVDALIADFADEHITRVIQHTFYCPVDVYVYDSNGDLAGSIVGDEVTVNDENLILYSLLDSKVAMYSEDMEGQYRFEVEGYADGTVTHSTTYYSAEGIEEMLVSETLSIKNGQTRSYASDPHGDGSYTAYTDGREIKEVMGGLLGVDLTPLPFTDVQEGIWYYNYVDYVYSNGLMNGVSDTKFEPDGTMTRAMLATVIYRASGDTAQGTVPFTDVPSGRYYTDPVRWAYTNGIVNGTTATTFSPDSQVTREQIVTMFYRYAGSCGADVSGRADLRGYTDEGSVSNFAKEAFRWAVDAGIINGTTATTLAPKDFATRAQCATIMQRFNEYIGQ